MPRPTKDTLIRTYVKDKEYLAKFYARLEKRPDGCVVWTGPKSTKGYGIFSLAHGWVKAHRFSYAVYYGVDKLPPGTYKTNKRKVIHHKCENKSCVNPLHLEIVTDSYNRGMVYDKDMF